MNNYQITKLQNMLTMLYDNNPYYSKIMKEMDCNPKFDNTLEIYQNMPFMDKATLLAANEEILTPSLKVGEYKYDYTMNGQYAKMWRFQAGQYINEQSPSM